MSILIEVVYAISMNITLLLFLAFAWVAVQRNMAGYPTLYGNVALGLLMGSGAAVGILASAQMGMILDVRGAIVALATLFGGPVPGSVAAIMAIITSGISEGALAIAGTATVLTALAIGLWFYRRFDEHIRDQTWAIFIILGSVLAVSAMFWMMLLTPSETLVTASTPFAAFTLAIYPVSAMIMGVLLARELRRYAVDEMLAREYDILQTALENVAAPVAITRVHDGRFLYANRAMIELLRIPVENIHHNRSKTFYSNPDDRGKLMSRLTNDGNITNYELSLHRMDGTPVDTLVNMQRILFDGEPALATSMVDISERKRHEQESFEMAMQRERMRMMSDFMQNISHDVKTPLSTMQTSLYLLDRTTDVQKRERHRRIMGQQVERLSRILDQFFEMARLDSGITPREQHVSLHSLLTTAHDSISRRAEAKRITLQVHAKTNQDGAIIGENRQLTQMLLHVLENAIHYTPEGGNVTLSGTINHTNPDWPQAVIEVCDTGIGIEEKHLSHIFERFYRVDSARGVETGGAGLGLAIAQKIAEDHNGYIKVYSVVGEGSTFTICLPYNVESHYTGSGMIGYVPHTEQILTPV